MELNNIYEQMDAEEAWDNSANKKWAAKMPKMFGKDGKNTNICWIKSEVTTFENLRDGTSRTIMLLENPEGVPWTQPKDLSIDEAVKLVTGLQDGESLVAVFYDASTRLLTNKIDKDVLKALMTTNGGEVINWDEEGGFVLDK